MFWGILAAVIILALVVLRLLNVRRINAMFTNPGFSIFLSAPVHLALEDIKTKLEPELGPITEANREEDPKAKTFRSHLLIRGTKFTIGTTPKMPKNLRTQFAAQFPDPRAKEVLRNCYGGMTVQCFTDGKRATDDHHDLLLKVTRLLIDDRAMALGTEPATNILPLDEDLREAIEENDFVTVMQALTAPPEDLDEDPE
jgi:hypothetical protein